MPRLEESPDRLLQALENEARETLRAVPTTFAKLLILSRLRSPDSLEYGPGLLDASGHPELAQQALARLHRELFWEWLALGLEEQTRQLERQADFSPDAGLMIMADVYQAATSASFLPQGIERAEHELFTQNFEMSVGILLGRATRRLLGD